MRMSCFSAVVANAIVFLAGAAVAQTVPVPDSIKKAGELSFCSELGDPPAANFAMDGVTPEGFEVDIMKAIGGAMGVRTDIRNFKFATIFAALDTNKCDAIMSQTSKSAERLQKYNFVDYRQQASGLMVIKGNPQNLKTYLDLSGRRVAVLLGSANERRLKEANEKLAGEGKKPIDITSFGTNVVAFQELDLGRVDAFVSGSLTLAYFLTQRKGRFEIGGMPVPPTTLGIIIPKQETEKARAIQAAVDMLVTNGEMRKIVDRWGVGEGTTLCGGTIKCD
jgi:polar amino acid transport system substrate-binding protein